MKIDREVLTLCRDQPLADLLHTIDHYCTERVRDKSLTSDEQNFYRLLGAKIARAAGYAELHTL